MAASASASVNESVLKRPEIFSIYEHEIGALTPTIADEIISAMSDYTEAWVIDALKESALNNKRSWRYALAILKRWKAEGRGDNRPAKKATRTLRLPDGTPVEVAA